ncbi:dermonecrotic toxin domain-containing protein [Pseudomonas helleri]|uniref:dermonecrotic toxin domain-containing protein n=1 Tax=Pseudomonas helleri TaxID=1608996 RepID=UPI003F9B0497
MTVPVAPPLSLGRTELLKQSLIHQFDGRPTLRAVIANALEEALKQYFAGWFAKIHVLQLQIVWTVDANEQPLPALRCVPVLDAMLEHIAVGTPLNYSYYEPKQCYLVQLAEGEVLSADTPSFLDIATVERAMRHVLRHWIWSFQQAMLDFWNEPVPGYQSRTLWLGQWLSDTLLAAANNSAGLSDEQIQVVRGIVRTPLLSDRLQQLRYREQPKVYFAQMVLGGEGPTVNLLLPDLLIVHGVNGQEQLLQCRPGGHIESFATLGAYERMLGRTLPHRYPAKTLTCKRYEPAGHCLQVQAMIVLNNQLERIASLVDRATSGVRTLVQLEQRLRDITDPAALVEDDELPASEPLARVYNALPVWLRTASVQDRFAYRSHLTDLADITRKARGRVFNEGIADLHTWARQKLQHKMRQDQPLAPGYDPDDLVLDFAVPFGPFGTAGQVHTVTFTLTELALQNLVAWPGGHMTLRHKHNQLIQDWWLTAAYIRQLITRVNIGEAYPGLIRRLLLDDAPEALRREGLYVEQLRVSLPLLALEMKLQGQGGLTDWGYRCVAALMQPHVETRVLEGQTVNICPLGLVKHPRAVPDFVSNLYVIGTGNPLNGRCVLYRPLFKEALIEYASVQEMLDAFTYAGSLRDSVLDWLPDAARSSYADSALRLARRPAQAQFFTQPLNSHFKHDLFLGTARALAMLAERQTVSNAESRWASLKTGGWLLLNSVLGSPWVKGPLALLGWVYLTFTAVRQDVDVLQSDDDRARAPAIIDLLFNIALVLLHGVPRSPIASLANEGPEPWRASALEAPTIDKPQASVEVKTGPVYFLDVPVGNNLSALDFTWFNNPRIDFTPAQLAWLDRNRGPDIGTVKPVAHGERKGLYVVDNTWCAVVRGFSYQVSLEDEGVVTVNPGNPLDTGPWLRSDGAGKWDFDSGMRLRGGGPGRRKTLNDRLAQRNRQVNELTRRLEAFVVGEKTTNEKILEELGRALEATEGESSQQFTQMEKNLRIKYLRTVLDHAKADLVMGLENIQARHALKPDPQDHHILGGFYRSLCMVSTNMLFAQNVQGGLLRQLHPMFNTHEALMLDAAGTAQFIGFKRDLLKVQIQQVEEFQTLKRYHQALKDVPRVGEKMAREQVIGQFFTDATGMDREGTEMDFQNQVLRTLCDLMPKDLFGDVWERLNAITGPLGYTVAAHSQLADRTLFTYGERIEILESVREQYAKAHDALALLQLEVGEQLNMADYHRLNEVLERLNVTVEQELAQEIKEQDEWLPQQQQPGTSSAQRSSRRMIRTRNQGILIGVARARASEQEPEVVDVMTFTSAVERRSQSPEPDKPKLVFTRSSENTWDEIQRPLPRQDGRALGAIRSQCNGLLGKLDEKIRLVKQYSGRSRYPLEMEETLEREGQKLDVLIAEIERTFPEDPVVDKPKPGTPRSLVKRLREGATKLREQGIWVLKSVKPTTAVVEFLLSKGEVSLVRIGQRVVLKGERRDVVQEYEVRTKNNQVLWYAHLHYPDLATPAKSPSAAHFKLKSQRYDSQASLAAKGQTATVHYGKISEKMLNERFWPLEG